MFPFRRVYEVYRRYDQRQKGYQELRDILYVMSSGFSSGIGLKEAVGECCKTLRSSYGQQSIFLQKMEYMYRAMGEGNMSEEALFRQFTADTGFPELKQVAVIYGLCLRTGGDLPKAMIETADSMLRRLQLWNEVQARTSEKRLEFTVMISMVPGMIGAIESVSNYLDPLYESISGRVIMTLCLLGYLTSVVWSVSVLEGGRK